MNKMVKVMPLEAVQYPRIEDLADELNREIAPKDAQELVRRVFTDPAFGQVALVSSFGADSVVLLHMLAEVDKGAPVLFLETGMLFEETLQYQQDVAIKLGLTNIQVVRPEAKTIAEKDPEGIRHTYDQDGCCAIRKVEPMERATQPLDGWITGRKRFQGGRRVSLELAEVEGGKLKLNPLAHWSAEEIAAYMDKHDLPRHPLVAKGYRSLGCAPCTSPTKEGEDPRAGRWRGQNKDECGIHFINGKVVRP